VSNELQPLTVDWIEGRILDVRGRRVMLDSDLARIYGVTTKSMLQQVRRNPGRFPAEFGWSLSADDMASLRSQIVTSKKGRGGRRHPPWVFTEHGAVMLANVLKSPSALMASVEIVRAFVRLRTLAAEYRDLGRRIDELEQRYDVRFKAVFDAIHRLLETPRRQRGRVGFATPDPDGDQPARPRVTRPRA